MTPGERELLHYLQTYIAAQGGVAPTVREIQAQFGMTSPSGPARLLESLERQGLIAREPHRSRNIRLTRPPADLAGVSDRDLHAEVLRRNPIPGDTPAKDWRLKHGLPFRCLACAEGWVMVRAHSGAIAVVISADDWAALPPCDHRGRLLGAQL